MSDFPGHFITLDGGEGSGKSTVAREIAERLRRAAHVVTLTEEPTGTALGRHIWKYFQDPGAPAVRPLAELFLFEAARAQHVEEVIRPALERGDVVVCDRFIGSTIAYQGWARRLSSALVERLNAYAVDGVWPDLWLLLDVPVDVGLARAASVKGKSADAIGAETREFHERVREGFLGWAGQEPQAVVKIDASRSLEEVAEAAWAAVTRSLEHPESQSPRRPAT